MKLYININNYIFIVIFLKKLELKYLKQSMYYLQTKKILQSNVLLILRI